MSWTQSDLDTVQAAIATVAGGGVAVLEDAFGNRTEYHDLSDLLKVKREMESDINRDTRISGYDTYTFKAKT
jgi:hypothetical protein